jgi:hypothetical protein
MSHVIQASPYTKVFLSRDWQRRCIENTELINSDEKFTVTIPRSAGAIVLEHMKPRMTTTLIPRSTAIVTRVGNTEQVSNQVTRQQDDKELTSLVAWLTGGPDGKQFSETDQYGVVEFDMGVDYMTHVAAMMNIEAAMAGQPAEAILRRQVSMQQAMNERIKDGAQRSVALADERVLRALRNNYNYFYKQCQTNLENGMGKIIPSRSEVLAAVVLAEEVEKSTKAQQALMAKVQHIIDNKPTAGQ